MKKQIKVLLKRIGVYHPLQSAYRNMIYSITRMGYKISYNKYKGSGFTCNFCNASYSTFVPEYPSDKEKSAIYKNQVIAGYGENVYCPNCLSKNRERLVKAVIDDLIETEGKLILHFSPEKRLNTYLKTKALVTSVDLEPGFYKAIDKYVQYGDATKLDIPDNKYDLLIANHILEHIPQDKTAMSEFYRVLKKNGIAILQAPWSETLTNTIEEPEINDPERQAELFGQKDHVRIYSLSDYVQRLKNAGLHVVVLSANELKKFQHYAIQKNEPVVLCYKK